MKHNKICSLCGTKIMTRKGQKYRKIKKHNWNLCLPCYRDYQNSQQVFHEVTKKKKFKIEYLDVGQISKYTLKPQIEYLDVGQISKYTLKPPLKNMIKCNSPSTGKSVISGIIQMEWNKEIMTAFEKIWKNYTGTSTSKECNNGTNKE